MQNLKSKKVVESFLIAGCLAGILGASTGCQVDVAGQTLPSPYYQFDDVQFFPAGPENKLANETAELKKASARRQQAQGGY